MLGSVVQTGLPRRGAAPDRAAASAQVRVREHERDVPLYVLIRKWVQNDPETELMQPPAPDPPKPAGDPAPGAQPQAETGRPEGDAEKPGEGAEEPEQAGEELEGDAQPAPVQAPLPLTHREPPPTEVSNLWRVPMLPGQCGMCLTTKPCAAIKLLDRLCLCVSMSAACCGHRPGQRTPGSHCKRSSAVLLVTKKLPCTQLLGHHQRHWLAVRKHNSEKCKYRISRLRSRLNALLQAAPQQSALPPVSAAS